MESVAATPKLDYENLESKLKRRLARERPLVTASMDSILNTEEPPWLIDQVLEEGSLSILYGQPGIGKSFIAMDLALAVVYGRPWCGRAVQQGSVIYVAAEGYRSLARRLKTWVEQTKMQTSPDLTFVLEPVDASGGAASLKQFMTEAVGAAQWFTVDDGMETEAPPIKLIIFDTLSRCIPGAEENDASDMSRVIEWLDILRDQEMVGMNPAIMMVHHSAKGRNYERGSTVIRGAADTMLLVTRDGLGPIVKCEKQKNGQEFDPIPFKLEKVGEREVILLPRDPAPKIVKDEGEPILGERQLRILRALADSGPSGMDLRSLAKASATDVPGTHKVRTRLAALGFLDWDRKTGVSLLTLKGAERLISEKMLDPNVLG